MYYSNLFVYLLNSFIKSSQKIGFEKNLLKKKSGVRKNRGEVGQSHTPDITHTLMGK